MYFNMFDAAVGFNLRGKVAKERLRKRRRVALLYHKSGPYWVTSVPVIR